jgi:hypothetical protein
MILRRRHGLDIAEVWFEKPDVQPRADILFCLQQCEPVHGRPFREKHTLLIDLTREEEVLIGCFQKDTRNEIRRARDKDQIVCERLCSDDLEVMSHFCDFYDSFAAQKGLNSIDRAYLLVLAKAGVLSISVARDRTQTILVYHTYYQSTKRARLLHSVSLFRKTDDKSSRNMIGRANRLLHLQDMLWFKMAGIQVYDLGGWYAGNTDEAKLRINRFKEEFGGVHVCEFNCEVSLTYKGKAALWMRRLIGRS